MLSQQVQNQALGLNNTDLNNIGLSNTGRIAGGLAALLVGSLLFYATAFSQPMFLHNAAHDTRHAITAPCH